jgi:hypothetical protein
MFTRLSVRGIFRLYTRRIRGKNRKFQCDFAFINILFSRKVIFGIQKERNNRFGGNFKEDASEIEWKLMFRMLWRGKWLAEFSMKDKFSEEINKSKSFFNSR